jgi:hypothetical protein
MQTYTDEQRAAVIADAQLGMNKSAIARKHKLPRGTVQTWLRTSEVDRATALISSEKKSDLGMLLYEYLHTGLEALIAQNREVARPEYIRAQPADAIYLLYGTMADKLVSIFGALDTGAETDGDPVDVHGAAVVG